MNETTLMKMQIKTLNKTIRNSPRKMTPVKREEKNDCKVCGSVYETKFTLEVHMKEHETKCEDCNYTFKCPNSLYEHKKLCYLKVKLVHPKKHFNVIVV